MFARTNVRFAQFIGRTVTSLLSAYINRIRPSVIHTSADVPIRNEPWHVELRNQEKSSENSR
jgi:hypothetical protein